MPETFKNAVAAALVTAVLTIPLLGMQLQLEGYRVVLNTHWTPVLVAVLAVFLFQLAKPTLARGTASIKLPALPRLAPRQQRAALVLLLLAALVWPFFGSRGYVDVMTLALIYVVLGLGLNIVVGFAGLLDLGYVGFYAVGAYTYALCNQYFGLSFWECVPLSAAAAALFGFLLGFPVLRLRGDYLAIVTLGFGEIIRLLLNNLTSITGGPDGISGIPKPTVFGLVMARNPVTEGGTTFHQVFGLSYQGGHMVIFMYFLALLMVLFTYFVTSRLLRMPMGRAWEALREDEIACRSLGINPTRVKLSAFTLGAAFAGLAGSFFAARQGLVTPESFTFIESALILAIVVLGGMGSQLGVILAAILLTVLPELARSFAEYRMLIFGLVMVLMMMWRPQGLLPATRPHVELPQ
ncbi:high-affinity branched-chain amino acid ABC transporter permease LivM [Herbaspirillum rubrisubalbicans]|uniref:High-affinity branched-chain amino acid ABC transporter permease LivM n=1 Tax=Herbaspirillum rubrisubalbicans TaxID=80842 RepID=A0AAD0U6Y9_9BURK|nr:high-affinity branched-chain amino acid ABC transporter permease LivM [Herbaspirillum rubrisubalbicans]ALU88758.1 ABC-type branched-chain amino acid transport system, permease component protein [Herbaspirillum rubrisubalbicans M1]AYR23808.1 high-affinity branched-chain amino acid ABC transporter permease LivM [Herbaspirillum rubrisubalbicans]